MSDAPARGRAMQGVTIIAAPAGLALASDAPRDAVAALLMQLAEATHHPRLRALAAREGKPLGGRKRVDRAAPLARVAWLLEQGAAQTAEAAARFAVRELGYRQSEKSEVDAVAKAFRKLHPPRKLVKSVDAPRRRNLASKP